MLTELYTVEMILFEPKNHRNTFVVFSLQWKGLMNVGSKDEGMDNLSVSEKGVHTMSHVR